LAQAALATSLVWVIAKEGFGHPRPIFAPGHSVDRGERHARPAPPYATEMVIGVALGIGIADALVVAIGEGAHPGWRRGGGGHGGRRGVVGGAILVSEAAVSALLVVTVQPPGSGLSGARF
jgi:hypothetical protein